MSYHGRLVVEHITAGEQQVEFWLRHACKLTVEERGRLIRGDYSSLVRPFEPEWEIGEWLKAASNLWIRPEPALWRRGHYRIPFSVKDWRPRLVRRVPQVFDLPELDEFGLPKTPTPAAIADARLDGSYTTSHELAVVDEHNDGVDDRCLELYAAEAGAKRALGDSERTQERLAEIRKLPTSRRIVELQKLAQERGVDVRDDVKAFERRVLRRLDTAA